MSTEQIIELLIAERDRLNRAIDVLGGTIVKRRGRPPGKKNAPAAPVAVAAAPATSKKRNMSAAARKRISDAQKKRWADARSK